MNNIALFVRYGVELRVFLNEVTREKVRGAVVFHTVENSRYLQDYAREFELELVCIQGLPERMSRCGNLFYSSCHARNRLKGRQNYKHYHDADNHVSWKDHFKGNRVIYHYLKAQHSRDVERSISATLLEQIKKYRIEEIWLTGYSSAPNVYMAYAAKMAGCHTVCYINSWKDFYVNNYVPSVFDEVRVWNKEMKVQYLSTNTYLREEQVVVSGNPRLTALHLHKPRYDFSYYSDKYKIDTEDFILYTAINPKIYEHEPALVEMICKQLQKTIGVNVPSILIKTNPMDTSPDRWDDLSGQRNLKVIQSDWEWHQQQDFNLPSLESEQEWFDLLHHCVCTMNVASTVTIESLVCGKPVVNIGFDDKRKNSLLFERYNNAPFYLPLLKRKDIQLTYSIDEINDCYNKAIRASVDIDSDLIEFVC